MKIKILVSLVIGFVLGAAVSWHGFRHFPHRWDSEMHHKHMMNKFSSRLNLTQEQQEKVSSILNEKRKKIEALREEMKPQFEKIRQETRKEISQLLNLEQQKKYDILDAEMTARRQKK